MTSAAKPTIAISTGDPAGVGPEIVCKALADVGLRNAARWVLIGERWVFDKHQEQTPLEIDQHAADWKQLDGSASVALLDARQLGAEQTVVGKVDAACGAASLEYVCQAAAACIDGRADAMVTAPLSKEAVALNGVPFTGHTEYIADLCGRDDSRLLLYHKQISVVHVSTHVSLVEAARLDIRRITKTIELGAEAMRRFGVAHPRVAVCGLNPHAGENGLFGTEEAEFIAPAIEAARGSGIDCYGPLPADTVFLQAVNGAHDLVVAMYHDQGHAPMKLFDFEHTVNVTLGLPIIRTSVDHGTAFDIAGKGLASEVDMQTAMRLALRMAGAPAPA
ncbi:MAG: 4-hydroxythreonine-4-phosphate dehydrogenase PdxA [Planctomycetota bacterium]